MTLAKKVQPEETMKTDNELRGIVTGNSDRLTDDELDLLVWALQQDIEGDMGRRSKLGFILDNSAMGYQSVQHPRCTRIRTSEAGGWTDDVGLRCGPVFVSTPGQEWNPHDMTMRILDVGGKDRAVRAMLLALGAHAPVLWRCYVARYPEGLRASLAVFSDLAPLVADTKAAWRARTAAHPPKQSRTSLAYCQGLSARLLADTADEEDKRAMTEICLEAEGLLGPACKCVKASLAKHRKKLRRARELRKGQLSVAA